MRLSLIYKNFLFRIFLLLIIILLDSCGGLAGSTSGNNNIKPSEPSPVSFEVGQISLPSGGSYTVNLSLKDQLQGFLPKWIAKATSKYYTVKLVKFNDPNGLVSFYCNNGTTLCSNIILGPGHVSESITVSSNAGNSTPAQIIQVSAAVDNYQISAPLSIQLLPNSLAIYFEGDAISNNQIDTYPYAPLTQIYLNLSDPEHLSPPLIHTYLTFKGLQTTGIKIKVGNSCELNSKNSICMCDLAVGQGCPIVINPLKIGSYDLLASTSSSFASSKNANLKINISAPGSFSFKGNCKELIANSDCPEQLTYIPDFSRSGNVPIMVNTNNPNLVTLNDNAGSITCSMDLSAKSDCVFTVHAKGIQAPASLTAFFESDYNSIIASLPIKIVGKIYFDPASMTLLNEDNEATNTNHLSLLLSNDVSPNYLNDIIFDIYPEDASKISLSAADPSNLTCHTPSQCTCTLNTANRKCDIRVKAALGATPSIVKVIAKVSSADPDFKRINVEPAQIKIATRGSFDIDGINADNGKTLILYENKPYPLTAQIIAESNLSIPLSLNVQISKGGVPDPNVVASGCSELNIKNGYKCILTVTAKTGTVNNTYYADIRATGTLINSGDVQYGKAFNITVISQPTFKFQPESLFMAINSYESESLVLAPTDLPNTPNISLVLKSSDPDMVKFLPDNKESMVCTFSKDKLACPLWVGSGKRPDVYRVYVEDPKKIFTNIESLPVYVSRMKGIGFNPPTYTSSLKPFTVRVGQNVNAIESIFIVGLGMSKNEFNPPLTVYFKSSNPVGLPLLRNDCTLGDVESACQVPFKGFEVIGNYYIGIESVYRGTTLVTNLDTTESLFVKVIAGPLRFDAFESFHFPDSHIANLSAIGGLTEIPAKFAFTLTNIESAAIENLEIQPEGVLPSGASIIFNTCPAVGNKNPFLPNASCMESIQYAPPISIGQESYFGISYSYSIRGQAFKGSFPISYHSGIWKLVGNMSGTLGGKPISDFTVDNKDKFIWAMATSINDISFLIFPLSESSWHFYNMAPFGYFSTLFPPLITLHYDSDSLLNILTTGALALGNKAQLIYSQVSNFNYLSDFVFNFIGNTSSVTASSEYYTTAGYIGDWSSTLKYYVGTNRETIYGLTEVTDADPKACYKSQNRYNSSIKGFAKSKTGRYIWMVSDGIGSNNGYMFFCVYNNTCQSPVTCTTSDIYHPGVGTSGPAVDSDDVAYVVTNTTHNICPYAISKNMAENPISYPCINNGVNNLAVASLHGYVFMLYKNGNMPFVDIIKYTLPDQKLYHYDTHFTNAAGVGKSFVTKLYTTESAVYSATTNGEIYRLVW